MDKNLLGAKNVILWAEYNVFPPPQKAHVLKASFLTDGKIKRWLDHEGTCFIIVLIIISSYSMGY